MPRLTNSQLPPRRSPDVASTGLTAVLGPTNTGKTYFAIERMLSYKSGMIGLPLRLLAREVYDKVAARAGTMNVALVTGEEKIIPPNPRYWIATVEAMPLERQVDFLAIDEIQLAGDLERGRIFTSRLLHARGLIETQFMGAGTMAPILRKLFPEITFESRDRLSTLSYAGGKKLSRLPRRTAIVAFSADSVYAIAELIRRQRGGAAVVLGALSPRTRNAQAELYQSGDVEYLIATDAIGMGLNMDIDHVAFAARRKFDGRGIRNLRADELAQIAGRAGRHMRDGAFGVTAECPALDDEVIEAIEGHEFEPVTALQWRSETFDFSTLHALRHSLDQKPPHDLLRRSLPGDDEMALARLISFPEIKERATGPAALALLWNVCQVPDFRKNTIDQHARLLGDIYEQIVDNGRLGDDWLAPRIDRVDRIDGDIDAISTRISYIRTWTYLTNRASWVENAHYWQSRTRSIEDALSDALHEKLTHRFVDRRTSVLMRKLRDDAPLLAGVTENGEVTVEGQFVGRLLGFEFILDPGAKGPEARKIRYAAERALAPTLAARAALLANAGPDDFQIEDHGAIAWRQSAVAMLEKGPAPFRPTLKLRSADVLSSSMRGRVQDRLNDYLANRIEALLGDLLKLKAAVDKTDDENGLSGLARGIAYQLIENFGAMSRAPIANELKQLGQEDRAKMRNLGVRFGEYTLFMPNLLKPAPARLLTMLWAIWTDRPLAQLSIPKAGLVSIPVQQDTPHAYYYALGYRPSGERAVRIDMLERLARLIRTAREAPGGREGFEATSQMMSLVGCSGEDFEGILKSLGFKKHTVKRAPTPLEAAAEEPAESAAPTEQAEANTEAPAEAAATETAENPAVPATTGGDATPEAELAAATESATDATEKSVGAEAAPTTDEMAPQAEPVEVTLWRPAPRRAPQRRPQRKDNKAGDNKKADDNTQRRPKKKFDKRPGKKGRPDDRPRQFTSGPRRGREPDPNSPFAVLAALKTDGNGKKPD